MYDVWREDQQIKTIKVSPASRPQYYIMKGKRLLLQHQFSNPLRENEDKCRKCGGKDDVCQANYDGGHHQAQSHLDNLKTYSDHSPPPGWTQNTLDDVWRSIPGTLGWDGNLLVYLSSTISAWWWGLMMSGVTWWLRTTGARTVTPQLSSVQHLSLSCEQQNFATIIE